MVLYVFVLNLTQSHLDGPDGDVRLSYNALRRVCGFLKKYTPEKPEDGTLTIGGNLPRDPNV